MIKKNRQMFRIANRTKEDFGKQINPRKLTGISLLRQAKKLIAIFFPCGIFFRRLRIFKGVFTWAKSNCIAIQNGVVVV